MFHAARNNVDVTAWKNSPIKVHEHGDLRRYKVVEEARCFRRNSFTMGQRQNGDATDGNVIPPPERSTDATLDILSMMSSMFDDDNDHDHEHEGPSSNDAASDELRSSRRVRFELEQVDDDPGNLDMQFMFSTPDVSISLEEYPIDSVAMTEEHFLMQHSAEGIRAAHYGAEKSRRDISTADFIRGLDGLSHHSSPRSEVRSAMIADELLLEIRSKHPELVEHLEFLIGFEREVAEPQHRRQSQTIVSRHQHDGENGSTLVEIDRCLRMPPERLEATVFQQHEELVRLRVFS